MGLSGSRQAHFVGGNCLKGKIMQASEWHWILGNQPRRGVSSCREGVLDASGVLAAIRGSSLAHLKQRLEGALKPAIILEPDTTEQDALALGASRLAGAADLPVGMSWPTHEDRPLALLAQIRLDEIAPLDPEGLLPHTGWLYFFHEGGEQVWGYDPKDRGGFRVFHVDVKESVLQRISPPEGVSEYMSDSHPCSLRFRRVVTLPDPADEDTRALGIGMDTGSVRKVYCALLETVIRGASKSEGFHHLFGYPQLVQGDMRLACQLVTHGLHFRKASAPPDGVAEELAAGAKDWVLLLQLDTDWAGPGWMWGECGRLYFWIRRQDLAARKFEAAWAIGQCY